MRKYTGLYVSIFLFLFGAGFISISSILLKNYNDFMKTAVEQKAVINNIVTTHSGSKNKTSHTVYVTYTFEGKEYTNSLNYYSSSMNIGDEITIQVNPKIPYSIRVSGEKSAYLIFLIVGSAIAIVAIIMIIFTIRKIILDKKLLENGKLIYAEIIDISVNFRVAVNKEHPFVITCKWKDPQTSSEYTYKSEDIWINPEPFLKEHSIDHLIVYIDENDPNKYFISLEELDKILGNSRKTKHNSVNY